MLCGGDRKSRGDAGGVRCDIGRWICCLEGVFMVLMEVPEFGVYGGVLKA